MDNINWFTKNYIENKGQCEFLLDEAEKKYSYTKQQIYEGCFELRKGRFDKDLLETHIKILGQMSIIGINASIAGIKIREALLDMVNYGKRKKLLKLYTMFRVKRTNRLKRFINKIKKWI